MNKLDLVRLGEAYARHSGLKLSTISTYAAKDGKWLGNLKSSSSASCTVRKANVVLSWFSDRWPADLDWPTDIPRPPKAKEVA